ncbi:alpha/beta hydrolase (plasmid) [Kovacikia minuta CCNUW1]|uniref:alpha/beta fold hydrolase n=1 Tax=Kovacikia minuta TaxID=2931930 RepID=UPI001CCAB91B|nr:alpha/beta hydrolase [Kovacikia minuta]UBF30495.1 alpha/beta hydrolase [Kovacikia minuta CCNUW1]
MGSIFQKPPTGGFAVKLRQMFADFLPSSVVEIHDAAAIALLQRTQRRVVPMPCQQSATVCSCEIATAYAYSAPAPSLASDAAPILLLHGFDSSLLEFRRLLPWLVGNHEIWVIDLLGAGFTEHVPSLTINPQNIRRHLLSVLESWITQPVTLVGASLGGAVAIDFALHHPNWVRSLVLIDSVGFSGGFPIGQFLPNSLIDLGVDWLYFRKHAALNAALTLPLVDPTLIDALRCSLLHQEMLGWKAAIASFTQSGGYINLAERITEIPHPTLILWGEGDDVLGTADATQFKQAISSSQLIWIPQARHVPHFEQPPVVATHLLTFSREIGR